MGHFKIEDLNIEKNKNNGGYDVRDNKGYFLFHFPPDFTVTQIKKFFILANNHTEVYNDALILMLTTELILKAGVKFILKVMLKLMLMVMTKLRITKHNTNPIQKEK